MDTANGLDGYGKYRLHGVRLPDRPARSSSLRDTYSTPGFHLVTRKKSGYRMLGSFVALVTIMCVSVWCVCVCV